MSSKAIAVGSDHGGFQLKKDIIHFLETQGIEVKDYGVYSPESVDYPDIGAEVALAISKGEYNRGILVCGAGIGMSIVANKYPGVRAALCHNIYTARMSREHNNANILVLGERTTGPGVAIEVVKTWLETEFCGGRHARRVDKITAIDRELNKQNK
jgi:ribose 5-phosphate isomerase B